MSTLAEILGIPEPPKDLKEHKGSGSLTLKMLAGGYNKFEAISAFHKELRRRDYRNAFYWAKILEALVNKLYVIKYLFQVSTEESYSIELKTSLAVLIKNHKEVDDECLAQAIYYFCQAPYKYMAKETSDSFAYEQTMENTAMKQLKAGIRLLEPDPELLLFWANTLKHPDDTFGPYRDDELWALLEDGLRKGNLKQTLYFYCCHYYPNITSYRPWPWLKVLADKYDASDKVKAFIKAMGAAGVSPHTWMFDYSAVLMHMNALGKNIPAYEPYDFEPLVLGGVQTELGREMVSFFNKQLEDGNKWDIPRYAYDPHTKYGKSMWYAHRGEMTTQGKFDWLDMRYSGYDIGCAWRRLAWLQHGTTEVPWEAVKFPKNLLNVCIYGGKNGETYVLEEDWQ